MNENVKTKTPKRRRWVARLLVSALCILLASSLLFVGVVADVISLDLVSQFSYNTSISTQFVCVGDNLFLYSLNGMLYLVKDGVSAGSFTLSSVPGSSSGLKNYVFGMAFDHSSSRLYLCAVEDAQLYLYTVFIDNGSFGSSSFALYSFGNSIPTTFQNCSVAVDNGRLVGVVYDNSSGGLYDTFFTWYLGDFSYSVMSYEFSNRITTYDSFLIRSCSVALDGIYYFPAFGCAMDFNGNILFDLDFPVGVRNGLFVFGDSVCITGNGFIYSYGSTGGLTASYQYFDFYTSGQIVGFSSGNYLTLVRGSGSGTFDSALFENASSPPESSDETTESSPPESSDETSDPGDIPEGYTKIWYASLDSDGSYSSRVIGAIDLREAVEVRAYLGSWTSIDASFQSDVQVPLTIQVFNSEEGPPVVYTYDYYAAGYAVDSGIPDDFVFPDFIGDYVTLPYNGELNIYFADVSPSGTVLVSTPATWGGRVTLNLTSSSSYFRLDFIDEDTFAVVVFNSDGPGSRVNFNFDIRAYREYYIASDGDKTTSRWFTPSFGTSVSYSSERILNDGLYMIFVDSYNDTEYPWENGDWSSAIDDISSRLDDLSYDHALLESLANDAYGDFPFGPANRVEFDEAISNFETIKDSSGGDYIFRYMSGLWTIHPFASSMVIIVGTFAIIGFIIRKL